MTFLDKHILRLATAMGLIGFLGILLIAAATSLDVVLRWFGFPILGVNDLISIALTLAIPACLPASVVLKQNLSVTVLGTWLGPRAFSALEAFGSLLVLAFLALIVWQFIPYSTTATNSGVRTWILGLPLGPWWWGATVLLALTLLVQFLVLVKEVIGIFWPAPHVRTAPQPDGPLQDRGA